MKFTNLALLSAATLAVAQPQHQHAHNHAHRHLKRGSPVQGRDKVVTTTAPGPVVTVYELNGVDVPQTEVDEGLKNGKYVLVGGAVTTATPTTTSTSSSATPTVTSSISKVPIVAFEKAAATTSVVSIEEPTSTSTTSSSTTSTPEPTTSAAPKTTSTKAPAASSSASSSSSSSSSSSGSSSSGGSVDVDFPSGTIPCSEFPSAYGPVPATWLGLNGYTGIQVVPDFDMGVSKVISYIETAISGSKGCVAGSFCSYACPAGTQKSQWPTAQGATGQSIGGLYCNTDGMLELSNPDEKQLCTPGVGGVSVENTLSKNVCVCRTDYPGTESETIALNVAAGGTEALTCPDAKTYYQWEGSHTSAQYYINNAGLSEKDACTWGTAGSNAGNWAPVNAGVGRGTDGVKYISLFPNAPTNPDGVLNFNIKITGGTGTCEYIDGKYYGNDGVESPTGCTVGVGSDGDAVFKFYS